MPKLHWNKTRMAERAENRLDLGSVRKNNPPDAPQAPEGFWETLSTSNFNLKTRGIFPEAANN